MKKFIKLFVTVFVCLSLLSIGFITACNNKQLSGEMKVVIVNEDASVTQEYTVDLANFNSSQHVSDVIKYLTSTENFYYSGTTSIYGIYLTEIGTTKQEYDEQYKYYYENQTPIIKEDATNSKYISVYTTIEEDTSNLYSKQYGDITVYASNFGVSSMHIQANAVIYFTLITYNY
jgi:hypothetical protein